MCLEITFFLLLKYLWRLENHVHESCAHAQFCLWSLRSRFLHTSGLLDRLLSNVCPFHGKLYFYNIWLLMPVPFDVSNIHLLFE